MIPFPASITQAASSGVPVTTTTGASPQTGSGSESTVTSVSSGSSESTTAKIDGQTPNPSLGVSGLSGGSLAGIAIAVLVLVPGLTYVGYYFWNRRTSGFVERSQRTTFRKGMQVDEEPVISQDADDSYT